MIFNPNIWTKLHFNPSRRKTKENPFLRPPLSKGHLSLCKSAIRAKAGEGERNIGFHVHSQRTQKGQEGKSVCDFTASIFVMITPTKLSQQPLVYFSSQVTLEDKWHHPFYKITSITGNKYIILHLIFLICEWGNKCKGDKMRQN